MASLFNHFLDRLPPALAERARARLSGGAWAAARNFAWLSGDRVLRMGTGFLLGALVARHLGLHGFGTLNYALAATGLLGAFASLGFDGLVARDLVRSPERENALLGTLFWSRLAAVAALYLAVLALAWGSRGEPGASATMLLAGAMMLTAPLSAFNMFFDVRLQARYAVWAANGAFFLCTAARIWLIGRGAGVAPFAATYLIEPLLTAAVLFGFYRRAGGRVSAWTWEWPLAKKLLREGWPLLLSGFAVMIYMRLDQVMLARMRGEDEVGLFGAALRFSEVWYFIPLALSSSLFPALVRSRATLPPAAYAKRLGRYYDLNAALAYGIIAVLAPISPWLFATVYGHGFAGADRVFQIHLWACLFVFLGVARGPYLLNEGFARFSFLSTAYGAATNVSLNLLLIPRFGAVGAAVATVISQALSTTVSSLLWAPARANGWLQVRALLLPVRVLGWAWRAARGAVAVPSAGEPLLTKSG